MGKHMDPGLYNIPTWTLAVASQLSLVLYRHHDMGLGSFLTDG
jgi:hypothetical protein